jgi:hypothetical protein
VRYLDIAACVLYLEAEYVFLVGVRVQSCGTKVSVCIRRSHRTADKSANATTLPLRWYSHQAEKSMPAHTLVVFVVRVGNNAHRIANQRPDINGFETRDVDDKPLDKVNVHACGAKMPPQSGTTIPIL